MSTAIPYSTTGVYLITNTITGAVYVGSSSTSIDRRWNEHRKLLRVGTHENDYLQKAWTKYGESAFSFEIVEVVHDPALVTAHEQVWLNRYYPLGKRHCYNISPTAGSCLGVRHSLEHRARLSIIRTGIKQSPETIAKRVEKNRGQKRTQETRERMSEAQRKRGISPDLRLKMIEGRKGKPYPRGMKRLNEPRQGFVSPDGTVYRDIERVATFAREHGLSRAGLYKLEKGLVASHRGWTRLTPITTSKTTRVFSLIGPDGTEYIGITSLEAFCKAHKLPRKTIGEVYHGKLEEWRGWKRLVID